jgi:transketolase
MKPDELKLEELKRKSLSYRRGILTFIYEAGAGHTGGSLSCIDIINVLYNAVMNIRPENWESRKRDVYIQSKGHSVEALYIVLADLGFFDPSELRTGNRFQARLIGHPTRKVPGIEHNTGGLGHGLSVSVGLALAARLDRRSTRVFCLLGDGELNEGSNWEAALSAAHYKLDNLVAVVDRNGLQISGTTAQVNDLEPLEEKWSAFGWAVRRTDGHDIPKLVEALNDLPFVQGKPGVLIAETVKGRGISFIEGRPEWHHKVPSREQYQLAMQELETLS